MELTIELALPWLVLRCVAGLPAGVAWQAVKGAAVLPTCHSAWHAPMPSGQPHPSAPLPCAGSYSNMDKSAIVSLYVYGLAAKAAIAAAAAHLLEGKMRIMTVSDA